MTKSESKFNKQLDLITFLNQFKINIFSLLTFKKRRFHHYSLLQREHRKAKSYLFKYKSFHVGK